MLLVRAVRGSTGRRRRDDGNAAAGRESVSGAGRTEHLDRARVGRRADRHVGFRGHVTSMMWMIQTRRLEFPFRERQMSIQGINNRRCQVVGGRFATSRSIASEWLLGKSPLGLRSGCKRSTRPRLMSGIAAISLAEQPASASRVQTALPGRAVTAGPAIQLR